MESYTCTNIYKRLETGHSKLNEPGERFLLYGIYVRTVFDRMKFCFNQTAFNSFSGVKNNKFCLLSCTI